MHQPSSWPAASLCGGLIRDPHQPAPHREEKRKARRQQFVLLAAVSALAGLVVWFVGHTIIAGYVEGQEAKNAFLKNEIAVLDKEIVEIKGLREQAEALLSRKQVIESLQTNRTETVQIFNELARQMPEGIYLKSPQADGLENQSCRLCPVQCAGVESDA